MSIRRSSFALVALVALFAGSWALQCAAAIVPVSDATALRNAILNATPGDEIVVAAGTYVVDGNITASTAGTAAAPVTVRAAQARRVLVRFGGAGVVEGFRIAGPYWRFEDLDIEGTCAADENCEHAFHIFGAADFVVIRNNVVRDFNAQIKSNGEFVNGEFVFPDDVLIERNTLYDTRARQTGNPVTKLDVVGGRRWIVRANTIYDFEKGGGDTISYAGFLKGNSRDGIFERNLVRCSRFTQGGVRLGLSFGGGGTAAQFCEEGSCATEHQNGIMRNNLVMNCSDVGIYINRGVNTRLQHNTLYETSGIDLRFATTTGDLRNNLVGGAIRNRDQATSSSAGDLSGVSASQFATWFVAPQSADFRLLDGSAIVNQGVAAPLVVDDFCGAPRNDGQADIGAVEYSSGPVCITTGGGGLAQIIFADGFDP